MRSPASADGPAVHVRAGEDLAPARVVQDHALAHAGRRDGRDVGAGRARRCGRAQRVPDAGGDGLPARVHVEVLAAGHAGRLVVGPLPLPRAGLLAGLGEQHGPAASGARVDGEQVRSLICRAPVHGLRLSGLGWQDLGVHHVGGHPPGQQLGHRGDRPLRAPGQGLRGGPADVRGDEDVRHAQQRMPVAGASAPARPAPRRRGCPAPAPGAGPARRPATRGPC